MLEHRRARCCVSRYCKANEGSVEIEKYRIRRCSTAEHQSKFTVRRMRECFCDVKFDFDNTEIHSARDVMKILLVRLSTNSNNEAL